MRPKTESRSAVNSLISDPQTLVDNFKIFQNTYAFDNSIYEYFPTHVPLLTVDQ